MAGGFGGSAQAMNSSLKENRKLRKHSIKRYKKLKSLYLGAGNSADKLPSSHQLTDAEIAEGRERVRAYLKLQKTRLILQITIGVIIGLGIAFLIFWFLSYLLTTGAFERPVKP